MTEHKKSLISGYTMAPLIGPGSILQVVPFELDCAKPGDIICFSHGKHKNAARRIVKIEQSTEEPLLHVKEDGGGEMLQIPPHIVTSQVLGVANRTFSVSTESIVGKIVARAALSERPPLKIARKGLKLAAKIASRIKIESPF